MELRFGTRSWWLVDRRTGRRVIAQRPNGPILAVTAAAVVSRFAPAPEVRRWALGVGTAALAWWSVLEIVSGANPFRRLLGVAGAVAATAQAVSLSR